MLLVIFGARSDTSLQEEPWILHIKTSDLTPACQFVEPGPPSHAAHDLDESPILVHCRSSHLHVLVRSPGRRDRTHHNFLQDRLHNSTCASTPLQRSMLGPRSANHQKGKKAQTGGLFLPTRCHASMTCPEGANRRTPCPKSPPIHRCTPYTVYSFTASFTVERQIRRPGIINSEIINKFCEVQDRSLDFL